MILVQPSLQKAVAGCLLLAASVITGCGAESQKVDPQTEDPTPTGTVFVPCPGAEEPGPTGLTGADVTRVGTAGSIEVTVAFCNPLIPEPPDELLFFVTLADHFGLAPSDLTTSATSATTGADRRTGGPFTWDGDDLTVDDHHAKGHLHSPDVAADGTPLLCPEATYLDLTLGGIGGDGQIVVRWEQEYLP